MFLQVVFQNHLMDETGGTVPAVVGQRVGECDVKREIVVFPLDFTEFFFVEKFLAGAAAVPERYLSFGV